MFYREVGDLKTTYRSDSVVLSISQERYAIMALLAFMYFIVPWAADDFMLNTIVIPMLIFALAALGLNLLTGYAGLVSLGTGGFMGVGAFSCYKLATIFPDVNIVIHIFLSGFFAAAIGVDDMFIVTGAWHRTNPAHSGRSITTFALKANDINILRQRSIVR